MALKFEILTNGAVTTPFRDSSIKIQLEGAFFCNGSETN